MKPPIESFLSPQGRAFTLADGTHSARWKEDPLWCDTFPILYEGKPAGKLFRSLSYGRTADGAPRWHATVRELYWNHAHDAPSSWRGGFDVAAFDTAEAATAAWSRSADEILGRVWEK